MPISPLLVETVARSPYVLALTARQAELGVGGTVALILILVGLLVGAVWLFVAARWRRIVNETSKALAQLETLNEGFRSLVPALPPIAIAFNARVNSKRKLDQFDFLSFMGGNVLENEKWFEAEIAGRLNAVERFNEYHSRFEALAGRTLGTSRDPRVRIERFVSIESKAYHQRKLAYPFPMAAVSATVRYTSPQGRNSYSRQMLWNFVQLSDGLRVAQELRARQSSAAALRQRERTMMTPGLRTSILRRDDFRCRMCGASAKDGVTLHVDHVLPVSQGGQTRADNLQTLCQPCNLGKGNRFVG